MFNIITKFALLGIIFLIVATGILVYFNFKNPDISAKIFSGILVGAATIFVSIYFSLSSFEVKRTFITSIIMDEGEHLPVNIFPQGYEKTINKRLEEIYELSTPRRAVNGTSGKTELTIERPETSDDTSKFLMDLLQYKIVVDLASMQRPSETISWYVVDDKIKNAPPGINRPFKPADSVKIQGKTILDIFSDNQFAKGIRQTFRWENGFLFLPESTELSLEYVPSSKQTGVKKSKVILIKPNYFKVEFTIEPMGGGVQGVPKGLIINEETEERSKTYYFIVTMTANFEKITAGNPKTIEYKKWTEWIFEKTEEINSDSI